MDKKQLRKLIRENPVDSQYLKKASTVIQKKTMELPEYISGQRIFCYVSMDTEVSTDLIIEDSLKNREVYVPKCYGNGIMKAVRIRSLSDLQKGSYGIMEPVCDSETSDEFDLMIIPCMAAGKNGERLGHGAGYYDRFLKGSKGKKICLCCSENIRDDIEMDDNDIFMDIVVSENAVKSFLQQVFSLIQNPIIE